MKREREFEYINNNNNNNQIFIPHLLSLCTLLLLELECYCDSCQIYLAFDIFGGMIFCIWCAKYYKI